MIQNYQIDLILDNKLSETQVDSNLKEILDFIKINLSTDDISIEKEGLKRLAYPIKKNWNGYYVTLELDLDLENTRNIKKLENKLNLSNFIWRHLILNQTDFNKAIEKQEKTLRQNPEVENHKDLNKGKKKKTCYINYLGLQVIDYKDVELLSEFTSPYAKIFGTKRTGLKSINQRKVKNAIKRARHMALMPFSTKNM
jgi:small subunit ribosomal protein S18